MKSLKNWAVYDWDKFWEERFELYECWSCKQRWQGRVGPQECPNCKHQYLEWLSWNEHERYITAWRIFSGYQKE